MRDLDFKSLRLWVAVCELGSVRRAAEREHIEPSAVSKRIAALESALGTALMLREPRGIRPTPAGQSLLMHARDLLGSLDRIEADVAGVAGDIRGQVRIVASASAIAESLLDDIAAFMRAPAHRDIRIDIEEQFSSELIRTVREGGAALGVCWDQGRFEGLECTPWRDDRLVLAVPRGHALARRKSIRFGESLTEEHVGLPAATAVHRMLMQAAAEQGQTIRYRVVVSNFDAAFRVVAAGLGVSVVPEPVARAYASRGTVRLVDLKESWARRTFVVCHRGRASLHPAAILLLDHLQSSGQPSAFPKRTRSVSG